MRLATADPPRIRVFQEQDPSGSELVDIAAGQAAVLSTRQPGKETPSEDCAAIVPCPDDTGVLIVADGLGGLPAGEQASGVAIQVLTQTILDGVRDGLPLRASILDGMEAANQAVIDLGLGAATTLAVVEIQGSKVRPYHVGDSMILVVGQRGKIKLQTVAHSPIGYAVEAGFLDQTEAMHHEERHLVSNIIGSPDMHITIGSPLELGARDTLLLATDGLADNLHLAEIVDRIRKGSLDRAIASLAIDSHQRMSEPSGDQPSKPDDLTAILFRRGPAR